MGHGQGYDYPHAPERTVGAGLHAEGGGGTRFLDPTKFGSEGELRERCKRILRSRDRQS